MAATNLPAGGAIAGLFAAVATPVRPDGQIDLSTFDRLVDFLVGAGVSGICIAGATGEYPHFETGDRKAIIRRAADRLPHGCPLLVGIGAPSLQLTLDLGEAALVAGARAVLLPMPMFFRYEQDDLAAYCANVSRALRGPCLLYNLPDFTNGLAPDTVLSLLRSEEFIIGIKDSSGQIDNLDTFVSARGDQTWTLLVGDDRLLRKGLQAGWDGGISGVAGFCPELLVALYRSHLEKRRDESARLQTLLDDLVIAMSVFPTPWAIRIGLAVRGIDTGPLPLPLTATRRQQVARFRAWLRDWLVRNDIVEPSGGTRSAAL